MKSKKKSPKSPSPRTSTKKVTTRHESDLSISSSLVSTPQSTRSSASKKSGTSTAASTRSSTSKESGTYNSASLAKSKIDDRLSAFQRMPEESMQQSMQQCLNICKYKIMV